MHRFAYIALLLLGSGAVHAQVTSNNGSLFDPYDNSLGSAGALTVIAGQTITFDTSAGTYAITDPAPVGGGAAVSTMGQSQSMAVSNVNIFRFDSIDIQAGAVVNVQGTNPLAIISKGDFTLNADINANGQNGTAGPANNGNGTPTPGAVGALGGGSGGDGGGGGGSTPLPTDGVGTNPAFGSAPANGGGVADVTDINSDVGGGGGGYGGAGGAGNNEDSATGPAGGSAIVSNSSLANLLGGSGGAGGLRDGATATNGANSIGSGGAGGGAFELVAGGKLTLGANVTVSADGGAGGTTSAGNDAAGGGGSGGSLLIAADEIEFLANSLLSADGGMGGGANDADGGGGGAGIIALYANTLTGFSAPLNISLLGGASGGGDAGAGGDFDDFQTFAFPFANVPEPSTVAIWSLLGIGLVIFRYYRARGR